MREEFVLGSYACKHGAKCDRYGGDRVVDSVSFHSGVGAKQVSTDDHVENNGSH